MRINRLYWDAISIDTDIASDMVKPNVFVFWPSPIEFDPCFQQAGLNDFEPVDVDWKKTWRSTVNAAINHLSHFGTPLLRNPVLKKSWVSRVAGIFKPFTHYNYKEPSLTDLVNLCSRQDGYPAAIVDFGDQHGLSLMAADGHPILWVLVDSRIRFSPIDMANIITPGVPVEQRGLDWTKLLPGKTQHSSEMRG